LELPSVVTEIKTSVNGLKFSIVAYQHVTQSEALQQIAMYFNQKKRKPKKGLRVILHTIIGFNE
jgi:hypothetical protein